MRPTAQLHSVLKLNSCKAFIQLSFTKMASANVLSNQTPVMPKSHVGFDSITTQIERKLLKRGFQFNIICVGGFNNCIHLRLLLTLITGQTGLGKSTLINTIFASHLIDSKGRLTPSDPVRSTTEIQAVSQSRLSLVKVYLFEALLMDCSVIEENGVRLRLNIVDTPGYGDQVNNDRW